jgi:hypothetical protein
MLRITVDANTKVYMNFLGIKQFHAGGRGWRRFASMGQDNRYVFNISTVRKSVLFAGEEKSGTADENSITESFAKLILSASSKKRPVIPMDFWEYNSFSG